MIRDQASLDNRIDNFMQRKSQEFPELDILADTLKGETGDRIFLVR